MKTEVNVEGVAKCLSMAYMNSGLRISADEPLNKQIVLMASHALNDIVTNYSDDFTVGIMQSDLQLEFKSVSEGFDGVVMSIDVMYEIECEIEREIENVEEGGSSERLDKFISSLQSLIDYAKAR